MTEPDDGRFTFSTWNIYPNVSDLDRTWYVGVSEMLRLIQDRTFWMFLYLPSQGLWPTMTAAKVDYPQRINLMHAPLKINGWIVARAGDLDFTLAYHIRPEAHPDSAPMFSAEISWTASEMALPTPELTLGADGGEEFRSSSGSLT